MINIVVCSEGHIEIESKTFHFYQNESEQRAEFIKFLLDKVYYGGETLCLEMKDKNGNYTEVERWSR